MAQAVAWHRGRICVLSRSVRLVQEVNSAVTRMIPQDLVTTVLATIWRAASTDDDDDDDVIVDLGDVD